MTNIKKEIKFLNQVKDIQGKRILLRVDFNVPMHDGCILDDTRITATLPTINVLLEKKVSQIIIISHLGRPKNQEKTYSLLPITRRLSSLLGRDIFLLSDIESFPRNDSIIVLENIRFYQEEELNDIEFAKKLASYGDIFVNDAFSVTHRAHASVVGIAKFLPAYAGLLLEKELFYLMNTLDTPKKPLTVIIGGGKISTKLPIIHNIIKRVDHLLVGGGIANTLLWAKGYNVGKSLFEMNLLKASQELLLHFPQLHLPIDVVILQQQNGICSDPIIKNIDNISTSDVIMDIGPKTIEMYNQYIHSSNTILWNGPLGAFEINPFDIGTKNIAREISIHSGLTVAGGGDTIAAIGSYGEKFSFLSTAGGAFLEWMEGKVLPGIAALCY